MDDLISRQKVLDGAVSLRLFDRDVKIVAVDYIEGLSAAQPEIIRCEDCTYWHDSGKCDCFSIPERNIEAHTDKDGFCSEAERREEKGEPMSDLISRQAALDALQGRK